MRDAEGLARRAEAAAEPAAARPDGMSGDSPRRARGGARPNLRVMEVLTAIIEGFNEQLSEQNEQALSDVATKIRPNYYAPFQRLDSTRQWYLKVISSRTWSGTGHKTLLFSDYQDYRTDKVKLQPMKGLSGTVDFDNPATFMSLDSEELDVYVSLERDHLTKEIDRVFGASGEFSSHVTSQYGVLDKMFEEGDTQYKAGAALADKGWHRVSAWKGGPDFMVISRTVATVVLSCLGPYGMLAAALVNAAYIAVDMAEGVLDVSHGLVQFGVAVVSTAVNMYTAGAGGTALNAALGGLGATVARQAINTGITALASGIEYKPGGGIGYSFKNVGKALKGGLYRMAIGTAVQLAGGKNFDTNSVSAVDHVAAGVSQGFASGFDTGGNIWDFKWDTDHLTEHLTSGVAAGLSSWASSAIQGTEGDRDKKGNAFLSDFAAGTEHMQKISSGAIFSTLMTGMYHATGGAGFKNDFSRFNWNSLVLSHEDLGNYLGGVIGNRIKNSFQDEQKNSMIADARKKGTLLNEINEKIANKASLEDINKDLRDRGITVKKDDTLGYYYTDTGQQGITQVSFFDEDGIYYTNTTEKRDYTYINPITGKEEKGYIESNIGNGRNFEAASSVVFRDPAGKLLSETKYFYENGQMIASEDTQFDDSEKNAFSRDRYVVNGNGATLQYKDLYVMNQEGYVVNPLSQLIPGKLNQSLGPDWRKNPNGLSYDANTIYNSGCTDTAFTMVYNFLSGKNETVNSFVDYINLKKDFSPGSLGLNIIGLSQDLKYSDPQIINSNEGGTINSMKQMIDDNLMSGFNGCYGIPTIIAFPNHWGVISGARYDANGNIMNYLLADPNNDLDHNPKKIEDLMVSTSLYKSGSIYGNIRTTVTWTPK